jgi:mRNA interferase MazF
VTSKPYGDSRAIKLEDAAFATGSLRVISFARPGKLFTANRDLKQASQLARVFQLTPVRA